LLFPEVIDLIFYLFDLSPHLLNLLIKVLGDCFLMVAKPCDLTIALVVELETLFKGHVWNFRRVNAMLVLLVKLIA
jgi:hypothetical protein